MQRSCSSCFSTALTSRSIDGDAVLNTKAEEAAAERGGKVHPSQADTEEVRDDAVPAWRLVHTHTPAHAHVHAHTAYSCTRTRTHAHAHSARKCRAATVIPTLKRLERAHAPQLSALVLASGWHSLTAIMRFHSIQCHPVCGFNRLKEIEEHEKEMNDPDQPVNPKHPRP